MDAAEALAELRAADNAYHSVCIDIQEPDVPVSELPFDELADAATRVAEAARRLKALGN